MNRRTISLTRFNRFNERYKRTDPQDHNSPDFSTKLAENNAKYSENCPIYQEKLKIAHKIAGKVGDNSGLIGENIEKPSYLDLVELAKNSYDDLQNLLANYHLSHTDLINLLTHIDENCPLELLKLLAEKIIDIICSNYYDIHHRDPVYSSTDLLVDLTEHFINFGNSQQVAYMAHTLTIIDTIHIYFIITTITSLNNMRFSQAVDNEIINLFSDSDLMNFLGEHRINHCDGYSKSAFLEEYSEKSRLMLLHFPKLCKYMIDNQETLFSYSGISVEAACYDDGPNVPYWHPSF